MNEWKDYTLGEVIHIHDNKRIPLSTMQREQRQGNFRYYGAQGVIDYIDDYIFDGNYLLVAEDGENLKSRQSNIAIQVVGKFWVNNHAHIITTNELSVQKFIYYILNYIDLEQYLTGSAQPKLNQEMLKSISISLPELPEQKAIAEILSSLDDKIELLNRQNKTIEDLAQTYFRQWFIEGEHNGWNEKGLDEIAVFLNGLALQKYPYTTGEPLKVVKIKELNNGFSESTDLCNSNLDEKYIVNNGDVIFAWSGSLSVDLWKYGKGALNQHLFKVTSDTYPKWFYYFWIKYHMIEFLGIAEDKATTMGHIQRHHLSNAGY